MLKLPKTRTCIVIKNEKQLVAAKQNPCCSYIIKETDDIITMWTKHDITWNKARYYLESAKEETDEATTGFEAYQRYYKYCGKFEVDRMKDIIPPIDLWDSNEQFRFYNIEHVEEKMYKPIFVFDANSAFTYGVYELPSGFEPMKEYMSTLYERKKNATTKLERSRYKNLQVMLIGFFARIKGYVSTRSAIIGNSNDNIKRRISEIINAGGEVYLSNTDSIVTDVKGADIMSKYIGVEAGQFKLEKEASRLCYKSPGCYQVDDKVVYSGVQYFARKNTDLFEDRYAEQSGSLIDSFDFSIEEDNELKLCRVRAGKIIVLITNLLKEPIGIKRYSIKGDD